MPRPTTTRAQALDLGVGPTQSELPQNVARAVNIQTAPVPGGAAALAAGLAAFSPGLNQYLSEKHNERVRAETAKAEADALSGGARTYGDARKALSPDAAPWVQKAYIQTVGTVSGADYMAKLREHAAQEFDLENTDPAYAQKFVADFFGKQTAGLDDADFLETFTPQAARANAEFVAANQARLENNVAAGKVDATRKLTTSFLDMGRSMPADWLDQLKNAGKGMRLAPMEVENMAFEMAAVRAIEDANPVLLQSFVARTGDNQASFSERKPAEYQRAWAAALTAFNKKTADSKEVLQLAALTDLGSRIQDAKDGNVELDLEKFAGDIAKHVGRETLTGERGAALFLDARKAQREYLENVNRAGAMMSGTFPGLTGVTAEQREGAARMVAKRIAEQITNDASIPEQAKGPMILQRIVETGLKNRVMNPDHLAALTVGFTALPNKDGSTEGASQAFMAAQDVGFLYWKLDRAFFRQSFADPAAAAFYDRFYENRKRDPQGDVNTAYLAARAATIGAGKASKAGLPEGMLQKTFDGIIKGAHGELTDSTKFYQFWRDGRRSWSDDSYARGKLTEIVSEIYQRNPNMSPSEAQAEAAKQFGDRHVVVAGQWLYTGDLPGGLAADRVAVLEKALQDYKPIAMMRTQRGDPDDPDATSVYLHPEPKYVTADGPAFEVYLGGMPTGQVVNLDLFMRQYSADKHITEEVRKDATSVLTQAADMTAYPGDEQMSALSRKLELLHQVGAIKPSAYAKIRERLDGFADRHEAEKVAVEADTTNRARLLDPVLHGILSSPVGGEEVAGLLQRNSVGGERAFTVAKNYAARVAGSQGADYRAGLASSAAVLAAGYSEVAYDNAGRQLIGAGYDLGQSDKVIVSDLVRSGIATGPGPDIAFGEATLDATDRSKVAQGMLTAMRAGRFKLTEEDARRLMTAQLARAERAIGEITPTRGKGEVGGPASAAFRVAGDHQKAALAVLYIHSDPKKWPETVEALKAGDWGTVEDNLRVADTDQALTAVRLLAQDPVKFRSFLSNN